ncbi:ABC-type branched-subunit amino acid transport system ATPase component/ABC-type branched-subunit amino acid transport system permease subunit [Streptomyces phaeochromogenes]|uniref:branched-chain amino acid ABC transporter ATP-binding protein/permease n=1 Tax=Streptomyces phaeochromogenes TaxID=1923 RepID=UPI00278D3716|nr:branched-chain amino acid ABC transporter ATP-binding protein/permease [Streptomyces phaeochromogenes]MDQ0946966.1 ABC-type branched-subunit amino acid transport system ATPase component/ABC-type branched-subunit amino acid transport system permease subunit [Streptomyces phaeochromogenes]
MKLRVKGPSATRAGGLAAIAVAAWLLPYGLGSYSIHVVNIAIIYALLAIGMGLAMGISGQINLAQVAFFGVGAYTLAILTTDSGYGFWAAAVVAVLATVATGLFVGIPALRMQSHYLGIVTLGLALGFINWITNASVTGGADGISGIPLPTLPGIDLSSEYLYYYLELVVCAFGLGFGLFVVRTSLGRRLRAMRDDSLAAGAMGAEIPLLRMTAFLLASLYGGLAGVLYAGLIRYVAPETFSIGNMFILLAMVIIGGRRSLVGCVVGAVGLTLIREWLSDFSTYAQLGYGVVVVLMVVFAPTGLAGIPSRAREFANRRRRSHTEDRARLRPFQPYEAVETPAAADEPLLEIRSVTKDFRGLRALDDVSLTVRPGEIRGIVGPNGSGKTTLFNVISGFYRATSGQVRFGGRATTTARPYALSLLGVARTFQNLRLFGQLTVRENILVALDRTRTYTIWQYAVWQPGVVRRERQLRRQAQELLERFGLTDFAEAAPGSLPYGIQRRIEIARAMASRPRLLLLDEPAAGLNGEEVQQLARIVRSIRDSGTTVVLIEHNMGLVMSLCERVTVLSSGGVIAEGTPAEVVAAPEVIEAYLGDSAMADVPLPEPAPPQTSAAPVQAPVSAEAPASKEATR